MKSMDEQHCLLKFCSDTRYNQPKKPRSRPLSSSPLGESWTLTPRPPATLRHNCLMLKDLLVPFDENAWWSCCALQLSHTKEASPAIATPHRNMDYGTQVLSHDMLLNLVLGHRILVDMCCCAHLFTDRLTCCASWHVYKFFYTFNSACHSPDTLSGQRDFAKPPYQWAFGLVRCFGRATSLRLRICKRRPHCRDVGQDPTLRPNVFAAVALQIGSVCRVQWHDSCFGFSDLFLQALKCSPAVSPHWLGLDIRQLRDFSISQGSFSKVLSHALCSSCL